MPSRKVLKFASAFILHPKEKGLLERAVNPAEMPKRPFFSKPGAELERFMQQADPPDISITTMNTIIKKTILATAIAAFVTILPAFGIDDSNILANDGGFIPVIRFSDSYSEKVVTIRGFDGTPATHDVEAQPQKISAKVVANLADFDFSQISETMPVEFNIGEFSFSALLGEEEGRGVDRLGNPKPFDPAKTSATFNYYIEVDRPNGDTVLKKAGSIVFAWSVKAKTLTVTLTLANAIESGAGDISASEFIGLADDGEKGGSIPFVSEAVQVDVTFGTAQGSRAAYGKGVTKTSYRKFGSEAAGTLEELTVNTVTVQGAADVAEPVVATVVPATDEDQDGLVSFSGTVADLAPGTFSGDLHPLDIFVFVNDEVEPFTAELEETDAKGRASFSFTDVQLSTPVNTLRIVAIDESGNQTVITRRITTNFDNNAS